MAQVMRQIDEERFVQTMAIIVRAITEETDGKLNKLEVQLSWLENAMQQFKHCGTWTEGTYRRGNVVTLGAVWFCNADTTAKPGADNGDWSMMLAKPRDGKDGRDAPQPEAPGGPRTVRTMRR